MLLYLLSTELMLWLICCSIIIPTHYSHLCFRPFFWKAHPLLFSPLLSHSHPSPFCHKKSSIIVRISMYYATVLCCHVMNTVLSSNFASLKEYSSSVYNTLHPCSIMVDSLWGIRSHSDVTPPNFAPCMESLPMSMGRPCSSSACKRPSKGSVIWGRVGMSCPQLWRILFGSRHGQTGPSALQVTPGAWTVIGSPSACHLCRTKHIGSGTPCQVPPGLMPQPLPLYSKGLWPRPTQH